MKIINDTDFMYSEWLYGERLVRLLHPNKGYAVYSDKKKLVVSMEYGTGNNLDATVYDIEGNAIAKIAPSAEDVFYQYISQHPKSVSGIAVVGSFDKIVDNFQDWFFEINLDDYYVGRRISPAY
ncbi:globin family protein [Aeromonas simiae]|uniref:hypothetical protein n=1 Tax=Aeromonas simiae TaxID=218936 RepID=UPI0012EE3FC6|nr:hypothetical protein [Aeromonas simiae]